MADIIKLRRDTAANWTLANPILAIGEKGIETDTFLEKVGDGVTHWIDLPYSKVQCLNEMGQSENQPMSQKAVTDELLAIETVVFPLTVAIASSNAGTYEIGTPNITPNIVLDITRRGSDVSSSAMTTSSHGTVQADNKTITDSAISSGSKTYQIAVTQGGQTVNAPNQVFNFLNYRYFGAVLASGIPSDDEEKTEYVKELCQNNTLNKELSSSTTKTKTQLNADYCYIFVIPNTSVELIVKNANSSGTVENAGLGTFSIPRVNGSGNVDCKYVIVPASSNSWYFEIVNS